MDRGSRIQARSSLPEATPSGTSPFDSERQRYYYWRLSPVVTAQARALLLVFGAAGRLRSLSTLSMLL